MEDQDRFANDLKPPPEFKGWQERAKSFGQVNHTGEELMSMGLFAPDNEGTRW